MMLTFLTKPAELDVVFDGNRSNRQVPCATGTAMSSGDDSGVGFDTKILFGILNKGSINGIGAASGRPGTNQGGMSLAGNLPAAQTFPTTRKTQSAEMVKIKPNLFVFILLPPFFWLFNCQVHRRHDECLIASPPFSNDALKMEWCFAIRNV
jgi:hypothetical protein